MTSLFGKPLFENEEEAQSFYKRLEEIRVPMTVRILNVASCVLDDTTIIREHNGRGKSKTYTQDIDTIASSARQLAEMIIYFFLPEELEWKDATTVGSETVYRAQTADTPMGRYSARYEGRGEFIASGPTLKYGKRIPSVVAGVDIINEHYQEFRAATIAKVASAHDLLEVDHTPDDDLPF